MTTTEPDATLPTTTVEVDYWDLDCLLDWAEFASAFGKEIPWRLSEDLVERMRVAQAAGDETVYADGSAE